MSYRKGILSVIIMSVFAFVTMLSQCAFANNDTVNISTIIDSLPNITSVILEDYEPFSEPAHDINLIAGTNKTVYCIINTSD